MSRKTGIVLALTTAFLWGTIPFAGKVALTAMTPLHITGWRFVLAGGGLLALLAWRGRRPFQALRNRPGLVALAAVGLTGNYLLYFAGLALTTPTAAQIVIQMANVFFLAWGVLLFGERLTPVRGAGAALALAGVVLVTWNGTPLEVLRGSSALLGNALIAVSGLSWSLYAALQKKLNRAEESYMVLAGVFVAAAVYTLPVSAAGGGVAWPGWVALAALAYLAFNTLAAYGSFAESLQHLEASTVAVFTTFAPIVTVALTAVLTVFWPGSVAPEALTVWTIAGAALVVTGVTFVLQGERRGRLPRAAPPE